MSVRGFFKNVFGTEAPETSSTPSPSSDVPDSSSGMGGFLAGTTKLFDTFQTKKNDLVNDISSKFGAIRLPGDPIGQSEKADKKSNEDGDSSASEYGDDGDRPMYAEHTTTERRESVESVESLPVDQGRQCRADINSTLNSLFEHKPISEDLKTNFESHVKTHTGRSVFAKELKRRAQSNKAIEHAELMELSHLVSEALSQGNMNDDFVPATNLMETSFTLFNEVKALHLTEASRQNYLYTTLLDQPIWQSMRFWNAALFVVMQRERQRLTIPEGFTEEKTLQAETENQINVAFVQISKFIWRMFALNISKDAVMDFLRKQATAENLPKDKCTILQDNCKKFYQTPTQDEQQTNAHFVVQS